MKKSVIIAALLLMLASFVNEAMAVAVNGSHKSDASLDWSAQDQAFEDEKGALRYLVDLDSKRAARSPKEAGPFHAFQTGETTVPTRASMQVTKPPPTAPARSRPPDTGAVPAPRPTDQTEPLPSKPSSKETEVTTKPPVTVATTPATTRATSRQTATVPSATSAQAPSTATTPTPTAPPTTTEATTAATTTTASSAPATTVLNGYFCRDFEGEVIRLINLEREAQGIGPVTANSSLRASAEVRALEIIGKFSHERPCGRRWSTAITIGYNCAAENLAAGQTTPSSVVNAWMNSEGHRKNIMNPNYTQVGVACYHDSCLPYRYYWAQLFIG